MARKEMFAFLIAHNLTRCVMAEAASLYHADLHELGLAKRGVSRADYS
jgi:hypothetical protein